MTVFGPEAPPRRSMVTTAIPALRRRPSLEAAHEEETSTGQPLSWKTLRSFGRGSTEMWVRPVVILVQVRQESAYSMVPLQGATLAEEVIRTWETVRAVTGINSISVAVTRLGSSARCISAKPREEGAPRK